jgi:hypothetical protein
MSRLICRLTGNLDRKSPFKLKGQFNANYRKNFCSDFRSEITPELKGSSEITPEIKGSSELSL